MISLLLILLTMTISPTIMSLILHHLMTMIFSLSLILPLCTWFLLCSLLT